MHPVLFTIGGFVVGTHNVLIGLGLLTGAFVFLYECRRRGALSEQMIWIAAGALIGGALGARFATIPGTAADGTRPDIAAAVLHGGRSIVGGLIGGYIGVVLTKLIVRYRTPTGDLFAPAIPLGAAVGRWGCFFSELPGTPTTLPWGIRLTPSQVIEMPYCPEFCRTSALHPSFLYEIVFQLVMFAVIWFSWRHKPALKGETLKLYLLCYAVFRFFVEFVRGHEPIWHGLTRYQLLVAAAALLLAGYFIRRVLTGGFKLAAALPTLEKSS